jgi:hydroxyacylglutathione hydrolase
MAETNGYLFQNGSVSLIFDAPEGMADWLLEKNVRPDAIVLTHQHFDHVLDAARIKEEQGCPILAYAPFSRDLTLERLFGAVTGSQFSVHEFSVDQVLEGKESVSAGALDWRLLHIPGHAPDSLCFYQPELAIVFGGDVLFLDGVGRTDFPGGSGRLLISGIQSKLLTLPDETRVYPGHGPDTTIGRERVENPFLQ